VTGQPLGAGREFDRIRAIADALRTRARGLGDDCAVVAASPHPVVLSTDASVEGVHFRREWLSLEEVGWRATAAALSDLAAEGATVEGVLAAIVAPAGSRGDDTSALMRGVGAAVAVVGGVVLGGDLSSGPVWSVVVTVVGHAERPVTRSGAGPGDRLWITGSLGGARAALDAWGRGAEPSAGARAAFAHPEPRIAAGRWLAGGGARAMIDLSDGLADARHIAAASRVRVELDVDRIPVAGAAVDAALASGVTPQEYAALGGEDYELLVALPAAFSPADRERFERATGLALTEVGAVRAGDGVRATLGGRTLALDGFDHFR